MQLSAAATAAPPHSTGTSTTAHRFQSATSATDISSNEPSATLHPRAAVELRMCQSKPTASTTSTTSTTTGLTGRTMSVGESSKPTAMAPSSDATIAKPKRIVRTGRVNCRWLYNQAQASRGLILIDTRSRDAFEEDTIPSALSIPPMPHCTTLDDVEHGMLEEQKYMFSLAKRKLRDVVLFGDAVRLGSGSPKNENDAGNHHTKNGSSSTPSSTNGWLEQLEKLIIDDGMVTSIKILTDGFLTFKYRYPFFTTAAVLDEMVVEGLTRTKSGTHNLNYPNEILDGFLFLGNMWHAQSAQVMRHLGITHVVNASLDTDNMFANDGICYMEVKIKDKTDADIAAYFDATFDFIETAKRSHHGRVLVHCTQGISRSATLVVMYLMRAHQWSLVTAVNYAMACRGVVYPNQGFLQALMADERKLYNGNSLTMDEVDALFQHQIPDRPIPLLTVSASPQKSGENCAHCRKLFSLLEWKHRCSYCRKDFCSKCTTTRLAISEREKESSPADETRRGRRVCDCCVSRLWKINLPRPRKGLQLRFAKCKHLNVNSMSTFGKPVCISYFEGTDSQTILDVMKIRFEVKSNQILDIASDTGEPVRDLASLPDEAVVLVSIGKAGNVQEVIQHRQKSANGYGRRYQILKEYQAEKQRNALLQRNRFSSEGNVESFMERARVDMRRSNSFHLEKSSDMRHDQPSASPELDGIEAKFRELWNLSFPTIGMIDRSELLSITNPLILIDLMLCISSLSCGAMALGELDVRLTELGHSDADRQRVVAMLEKALIGK